MQGVRTTMFPHMLKRVITVRTLSTVTRQTIIKQQTQFVRQFSVARVNMSDNRNENAEGEKFTAKVCANQSEADLEHYEAKTDIAWDVKFQLGSGLRIENKKCSQSLSLQGLKDQTASRSIKGVTN